MPLFRVLDAAAAAEPLLMWLAWAMTATGLAALPAVAGRVPSLPLSMLVIIPGTALLGLSFTIVSMLLGDLVRLHPFLNVALALGVTTASLLAGWRHAGSVPRHLQSAEVALKLARPALVTTLCLAALTLHPSMAAAAVPPLLGAAVFITEVALTRLAVGAMKRASTSRSTADLLRFGSMAPVYVVPDCSMGVIALAVGLTPASSAVFVQQHIEDALQCNDPIMRGRAERILAHEAGHIVQRHGLWRTIAVAVVATTLPLVVSATDLRGLAILAASLMVFGVATFALGEWAAERFAERATRPLMTDQANLETIQ